MCTWYARYPEEGWGMRNLLLIISFPFLSPLPTLPTAHERHRYYTPPPNNIASLSIRSRGASPPQKEDFCRKEKILGEIFCPYTCSAFLRSSFSIELGKLFCVWLFVRRYTFHATCLPSGLFNLPRVCARACAGRERNYGRIKSVSRVESNTE